MLDAQRRAVPAQNRVPGRESYRTGDATLRPLCATFAFPTLEANQKDASPPALAE